MLLVILCNDSQYGYKNGLKQLSAVYRAETWVLLLGGYVATMPDK